MSELAERFEVMSEIGGLCARLAARLITPKELAVLERAHEVCKAKLDACIYHVSVYSFLAQEATCFHVQLYPYRRIQFKLHNCMQTHSKSMG